MLYITIILCIALAMFLLSADLSWNNVLAAHRNDIVFEGRLQAYGAYRQRKENHQNLIIAFLVSAGLLSGSLLAVAKFSQETDVFIPESKDIIVDWVLPAIPEDIQPTKEEEKTSKNDTSSAEDTTPETTPQRGLSTPEITPEATGSGELTQTGGSPTGKDPEGITEPAVELNDRGGGNAKPVKIETFAEVMPEFPGGEKELYKFLINEVEIPERAKAQGINEKIYASFVVTATGDIADVKIVRGSRDSKELNEEVVNALLAMPQWKPGRSGNRNVPVRLTIPFSFEIR